MSNLTRHKKPNGFYKLVTFLETLPKDKRSELLSHMKEEDAQFAETAEKYIFNFEEFVNLSDEIMCEIVHTLDLPNLAVALYKCSDEKLVDKFVKNIPRQKQITYKNEVDMLGSITVARQFTARIRIIETARELEDTKNLKIKPCPRTYEAKAVHIG